MADARLRELTRQERADLDVQVRLLRERVRSGELSEARLNAFAALGHAAAAHALGREPPPCGDVAKALALLDVEASQALLEAAVWCTENLAAGSEFEAGRLLRPEVLAPSRHPWEDQDLSALAREVVSRRRASLQERGGWIDGAQPVALPGRLLVYGPDYSLFDGLTESLTDGFFDVYDCPPWATWVQAKRELMRESEPDGPFLVAWVPPALTDTVADAARGEAGDSLDWLDELL